MTDNSPVHWITTGPGPVGDFVSEEEMEAAADYLNNLRKEYRRESKLHPERG